MSVYSTFAASRDADILTEFGETATFTPQSGSGAQQITVVPVRPPMEESMPPGFGTGTTHIYFWVTIKTIVPPPQKGDALKYGGMNYTVSAVDSDIDGGAILKLILN